MQVYNLGNSANEEREIKERSTVHGQQQAMVLADLKIRHLRNVEANQSHQYHIASLFQKSNSSFNYKGELDHVLTIKMISQKFHTALTSYGLTTQIFTSDANYISKSKSVSG